MDEEERKLVEEVMADLEKWKKSRSPEEQKRFEEMEKDTPPWVLEESAKITAAEERARKKWEALSDEEKERQANSPEVLEARFWEDWTDCDPVTNPISRPDKNESDR